MNPLFSIITVSYNAADAIAPTLQSVKNQTCKLYEYFVIDGGSTDDTVRLAEASGIENMTIISEPDDGIYDAMNKGLGIAKGDYVIFLNAGDSFHNANILQCIADAIMDNDYPGIVYGQTQIVDSNRKRLGDRHLSAPAVLTLDSFKNGMVVCHQAFVALRKIVDNFDTRLKFSADYKWCIHCLQRSKRNCYVDRILVDYLSVGTTTANHRASLCERFKIMAHYYGLLPTILRHVKFLFRDLKRRLR